MAEVERGHFFPFLLFGALTRRRPDRKRQPTEEHRAQSPTKKQRTKLLQCFKILVVGDENAGKTAIINRYIANDFDDYMSTHRFHFFTKVIENEEEEIILNIFDISGRENPQILSRPFLVDCTGAIVVTDVTKPNTFPKITEWVINLRRALELSDGDDFPCILLMNKCDIGEMLHATEYVLRSTYTWENHILKIFRTSAKTNTNVEEAFDYLIGEMKLRWSEEDVVADSRFDPVVERRKTPLRKRFWSI